FVVEQGSLLRVFGVAELVGEKGPAKVLVDKASGGESSLKVGREDFREATLVMVKVFYTIVLAAHVDNDVAGLDGFGDTGTGERCIGVFWELAEHVDGESVIGLNE